jgi:nitrite reductase (NADH) large subunit
LKVIIIGNSAAGLAAAKTFRKYDKNSELTIISKEAGLAYSRVLLPYVLRGKIEYNNIFIRDKEYYAENNIVYMEDEVLEIDTLDKTVILKGDNKVSYDKLLIATGSYAVAPPIEGVKSEGVYHMWTKADLDKLIPLFDTKKKVAVIGSGFVALQAAWAAKYRGLDVNVIEIANRVMPSVLDVAGANLLTDKIKESGVKLHTNTITQKIEKLEDGSFVLHLKDKEPIKADFIIVGTGVRSNLSFIEGTGIEHDRAIFVNENMKTNIEDVYSAGDVAAGPTTFGDKHLTHALWPTAVEMGEVAGANMAGKNIKYRGSLNMNVTQMYDVTVASMGLFNDDHIHSSYVFDMNEHKGYVKICYKNDLIVGACLVGNSESVKLFGKLRTIIRKNIKADCVPEKLENYLDIKIFSSRV